VRAGLSSYVHHMCWLESFKLSGLGLRMSNGQVLEAMPSTVDIDDGYEHIFKSFFERYGMCMAVLDRRLRVQIANSDLLEQLGADPSELNGQQLHDYFHRRSARTCVGSSAGWSRATGPGSPTAWWRSRWASPPSPAS